MSYVCPFINGKCITECIFNNECYDEGDPENCDLMDAVRNIQSDGFDDRTPRNLLESIESTLKSIDYHTSCDPTQSDDISEKLDKVLKKLDAIK